MRPHAATPSLLSLHLLWMAALLMTLSGLMLTGCASGRILPPSNQSGASLRGHVHGGQQPVAGAHVYLFAANTTGYAGAGILPSASNASLSLLQYVDTGNSDDTGVFVTTDDAGNFDISGDYTCTPNSQVYLYVHGGDAGSGSNSALGLLAAIGNCPVSGNFSSVPFIEINEISTIAAAYSFAAFASDPIHVSTNGSPLALTGIANAFATATNLADPGSGLALTVTPAGNGTVPQTTIDTLANILASCVNTADSVSPSVSASSRTARPLGDPPSYSDPCNNLGEAVSGNNPGKFAGYTYDTATDALFIAQNPGANTSSLFTLPVPQSPFNPILTSQPNDFTLSIIFTGAGITKPVATAIDSSGNVWIADSSNTLDALDALGAAVSGSPFSDPSLSNPRYIAIDTSGNIWLANEGANTVSRFTNAGAFSFNAAFSHNSAGLSIDTSGNAWIPNGNNDNGSLLTKISSSGTSTDILTGLNFPQNSVIDSSGNLWFGSVNSIGVTEFNIAGSSTSGPFTAGSMSSAGSLALDSSGDLWATTYNSHLLGIDSSGNALSGPPYNTASSYSANAFVLDGQNNFWLAGSSFDFDIFPGTATSHLTGVSSSGAALFSTVIPTPPSTGPFPEPVTIQSFSIDPSGNIWIPAGSQIVEYVGIAVPVETPVAQAVSDFCIAQRPCFPPS